MKKLSILSLLLSTMLLGTCTTEIVMLTGSISGVVNDVHSKLPLENVTVSLSPEGLSKVTGKDGAYFFDELAEREYTLTYTKPEYLSVSKESMVQARVNNVVDVALEKEPIVPILAVSDKALDFGEELTTKSFYISNTGNGELKWSISYEPGWFVCSPLTSTTAKEKSTVVVTANRNLMQKGSYQQTFSIASNGGNQDIAVTIRVEGIDLEYSPLELDFGTLETSKKITLTNKRAKTIQYTVETTNEWIILGRTAGTLVTNDEFNVMVKRESLAPGDYSGNIIIKSGNETYSIPVKMSVPSQEMPKVSLDPVTNITSTGATFSGILSVVGGSRVTAHGFCIGTAPEPTINNPTYNLGDCSTPKTFTHTATDLRKETTYYVRAYATNASGTSYSEQLSFQTPGVPVTGVSLNKTSLAIVIGSTEQLTATVLPSEASNKNVSWRSSNASVATVSATGLVTPVSAGSATITVTTVDGSKTATCNVFVSVPTVAVTAVSLNKTALSMGIGVTEQLTATVLPSGASNKSVTWRSSNTSVATVSVTGLVTSISEGSATITVTTADGYKTATCSVTVTRVAVTSVSLDKTSLFMEIGDTEQLTETITPSDAFNKSVSWSSSNTSVATVSTTGLVTSVAEGSTTITVTTADGYKTATCSVTVTDEKSGTTASLTWKLSNGTLTISGTGAMPHYGSNSSPWSSYKSSIVNVVVEDGVTNIGHNAFYECSNLASVSFSNTVTKIGAYSFNRCSKLSSVSFSNAITVIGSYAFSGCSGLSSIVLPNSLVTIDGSAFSGCKFATLVIPDNVTYIGDYAFSSCSSLYALTIGASVATIRQYAFGGCRELTSVSVRNPTRPNLYLNCNTNQVCDYSGDYSFSGVPYDVATLTVPVGCKAAYQGSQYWKCFGTIVEAE
jgi:uncharacterized protein YjdB